MVRRKKSKAATNSRKLPYPNTWVVLSVALLVIGLSIITALGPSPLTGNAVQSIGYLREGDTLRLSVRDVPGLETIFTHADEEIKYGEINAVVDDSLPFSGSYYSKFTVSSKGKFGPLQFNFKIKEEELQSKGLSRDGLRLYHNYYLQEYPLQILKVDHGYIYYIVTVPSTGSFILGRIEAKAAAEESVTVEEPAGEESSPEPLVGMAAESSAEAESVGFFARIAVFFRSLFS